MASVQTMKVVEKTSSTSSGGVRSGGSRYSEESSSYSSSGTGLLENQNQSSRVVYSAPVSQTYSSVVGGANELRSSQKIITEYEDQRMLFGEDAAKFILETREREKRELSGLNDRLAAYLEKMRHLELQNRDMGDLKTRWEQDLLSIKRRYEQELADTQRNLEDSGKIKATLDGQIGRLSSELADYKKRFEDIGRSRDDNKGRVDSLLKKLSETEAELNLLRRNVQNLEEEVARLKGENARLQAALQKAKHDLDQESLKAIEYQNQVQALLKKIEFLKHEHDLEVKMLSNRTIEVNDSKYQDELAKAIRDIRREFDDLAKANKLELESWYSRKVTEVRNSQSTNYQEESKRLGLELEGYRSRIGEYESTNGRLKRELQELQMRLESEKRKYESDLSLSEVRIQEMFVENRSLQEKLKVLFETNQTLFAEIAIYRKLLDGEEGRYSTRIQEVVKSAAIQQQESVHVLKEEMVTHTSFQRSNKGNIQFAEIAADGKYIVLENLSVNKDEHIGDWKLTRVLDNEREFVFTFPSRFHLKAGKSVRIWAKGQHGGANNLVDSLIFEGGASWGVGFNVTTTLFNRDGEEKATYVQTTTTSQRTLESS